MTRPRYRWLLPAGHTAIDLVVLTLWLWQSNLPTHREKSSQPLFPVPTTTEANSQEDGTAVGWDVRSCWDCTDPRFTLLASGTLPAGIISVSLRPGAGWQMRQKLWDPIWFLIHESLAIPFLFLLGMWIDAGRSRLGSSMWRYLAARGIFAPAFLALRVPHLGTMLQELFWLGLGCYAALRAASGCFEPPGAGELRSSRRREQANNSFQIRGLQSGLFPQLVYPALHLRRHAYHVGPGAREALAGPFARSVDSHLRSKVHQAAGMVERIYRT
jgi:hypothetical protein